jgi:PAS domain-containing protein
VPHVELSVSETHTRPRQTASSLARWATAVADAEEPSLVIDYQEVIVGISASFQAMLGLTQTAIGAAAIGGVLQLLDFADGNDLGDSEIVKAPPLLALSSGRLARGLIRVRCADGACTFDAISTPLLDRGQITGSLTFFSAV